MLLTILRALFILVMASVGWYYMQSPTRFLSEFTWLVLALAVSLAVFVVCIDMLAPSHKLELLAGAFFGLVVGLAVTLGLSFVTRYIIELQMPSSDSLTVEGMKQFSARREAIIECINMLVGVTACYLSISFVLQARDNFRFIIPFVEFSKQVRGVRPVLVDTSALIDGRLAPLAATGFIDAKLIVPRFVLEEVQHVADSGDRSKRNRGRQGLDVLDRLQKQSRVEVTIYEGTPRTADANADVDARLLLLARELPARLLTTDFNLSKVAQLQGVDCINLNELAAAVKLVALPGDPLRVRLQKPGDQPGQGVGYLDDGTMVVVEAGRSLIGKDVDVLVTSAITTQAGKLIFTRVADTPPAAANKTDATETGAQPAIAAPARRGA
jgi:uncharacterized protein YacL